MSISVDWSKAPADATFYACNCFRKDGFFLSEGGEWIATKTTRSWCIEKYADYQERYKQKTSDASASIANLLNAQAFISAARKSAEFSSHNAELADQADAIIQAIIENMKSERIPAEASFHLSNAQNELDACKSLLAGDKQLADAVFCLSEKLADIRKGEL